MSTDAAKASWAIPTLSANDDEYFFHAAHKTALSQSNVALPMEKYKQMETPPRAWGRPPRSCRAIIRRGTHFWSWLGTHGR